MTRIRMAALVVLAVLCVSATAAANEGEIVNKEGNALVKNKFTGTTGKATTETVGGGKVTCTAGKATGTVLNKTEAEQTLTLTGCESVGMKCNSEGQAAGEVQIKMLVKIVTNKNTDKSYLLTSISEGSGSFKCGIVSIHVRGALLTEVGGAQEHKLKTKDTFTAEQSKGVQKPLEYENEKGTKLKDTLEVEMSAGKKFEQAGLSSAEEVTFEEEAELLAFERYEFLNKNKELVVNKKFTSTGGISTLKANGMTIECKKSNGKGEVLGQSRLNNWVVTFEGCEETSKKCKVKSPGATNPDEIVTHKLLGELGEIPGTFIDDAGLDIDPEGTEGIVKIEGSCITTTTVESGVIGEITPENELQEKLELVYEVSGGKQKYMTIEEGGSDGISDTGDHLVAFGVEAAFVNRMTLTFEEEVEVRAP